MNENLEVKYALLDSQIDLVSHPGHGEVVGKHMQVTLLLVSVFVLFCFVL